ncbi:PSP1 C-terminal conserved region-domain-containing protein [Suillus lakei]|nr:PSP1 C-terminal conserved region-domain-containing protein [Suillus lakei]
MAATSLRSGAIRYAAPELVLSDNVRDLEGTDIYSFGCVMLQVLSGRSPWSEIQSGRQDAQIIRHLSDGYGPQRPRGHPEITDIDWNFIQRCLQFKPKLRPSADEVHNFISRRPGMLNAQPSGARGGPILSADDLAVDLGTLSMKEPSAPSSSPATNSQYGQQQCTARFTSGRGTQYLPMQSNGAGFPRAGQGQGPLSPATSRPTQPQQRQGTQYLSVQNNGAGFPSTCQSQGPLSPTTSRPTQPQQRKGTQYLSMQNNGAGFPSTGHGQGPLSPTTSRPTQSQKGQGTQYLSMQNDGASFPSTGRGPLLPTTSRPTQPQQDLYYHQSQQGPYYHQPQQGPYYHQIKRQPSDASQTQTQSPLSDPGYPQSVPVSWPHFIVEFKAPRTGLFYLTDLSQDIRVGDFVIVEADRGTDLGKVIKSAGAAVGGGVNNSKLIYGKAQAHDVQHLAMKTEDEARALQMCQSKVRQKKLPMEVIDAEYQWDRCKLTFYFMAEKRIDFRELMQELSRCVFSFPHLPVPVPMPMCHDRYYRLYKPRISMVSLQGSGGYES